jgi:hypothetical protein
MGANGQGNVGGRSLNGPHSVQRDTGSRLARDRMEDGVRGRDERNAAGQQSGMGTTVHTERTRAADRFGWKARRH